MISQGLKSSQSCARQEPYLLYYLSSPLKHILNPIPSSQIPQYRPCEADFEYLDLMFGSIHTTCKISEKARYLDPIRISAQTMESDVVGTAGGQLGLCSMILATKRSNRTSQDQHRPRCGWVGWGIFIFSSHSFLICEMEPKHTPSRAGCKEELPSIWLTPAQSFMQDVSRK